jgi:hypothetical protein
MNFPVNSEIEGKNTDLSLALERLATFSFSTNFYLF